MILYKIKSLQIESDRSCPLLDTPCQGFQLGEIPLPLGIEETVIGIRITRGVVKENVPKSGDNYSEVAEDNIIGGHNVNGEIKENKRNKRGKGKLIDQSDLFVKERGDTTQRTKHSLARRN